LRACSSRLSDTVSERLWTSLTEIMLHIMAQYAAYAYNWLMRRARSLRNSTLLQAEASRTEGEWRGAVSVSPEVAGHWWSQEREGAARPAEDARKRPKEPRRVAGCRAAVRPWGRSQRGDGQGERMYMACVVAPNGKAVKTCPVRLSRVLAERCAARMLADYERGQGR
jgi:hypothetical protein